MFWWCTSFYNFPTRYSMSFLHIEQFWVDSVLQQMRKPLLRDVPLMVWMVKPGSQKDTSALVPPTTPSDAETKTERQEATPTFALVKAMSPVSLSVTDQELLFLTRVVEDFFRNQLVCWEEGWGNQEQGCAPEVNVYQRRSLPALGHGRTAGRTAQCCAACTNNYCGAGRHSAT